MQSRSASIDANWIVVPGAFSDGAISSLCNYDGVVFKSLTLFLALVVVACGCGPSPARAVEPEITAPVPEGIISSSSVYQGFRAGRILRAAEPGWHAQSPPV